MVSVVSFALVLAASVHNAQGLLASSSQTALAAAASSSSTEHYSMKDVMELLRKMKETCEAEAKADLEAHDKKQCACETVEKERLASIADEADAIAKYNGEVDEAVGRSAMLKTQISDLKAELADSMASMAQLREQRAATNKEFNEESADMVETITVIKQAVKILSQVQLVQRGSGPSNKAGTASALIQLKHLIKTVQTVPNQKRFAKFTGVLQQDLYAFLGSLQEPAQEGDGSKFLQQVPKENALRQDEKPNDLEGNAAGVKSYNARSGRILGILKTMGEQVARDLEELKKKESDDEAKYQKLKSAILIDIKSYNDQADAKQAELAQLMKAVAMAKGGSEDTQDNKLNDESFLADMKRGCAAAAKAYEARASIRSDELKALDETLKILTEDDARSVMSRTVMSFLQVNSKENSKVNSNMEMSQAMRKLRNGVSEKLLKVAHKHHNDKLALIAMSVKLDAFTKVRAAMENLYGELKTQQSEELSKRDTCVKNSDTAEDEIKVLTDTKEDLEGEMTKVVNTIEELSGTIKTLTTEIADLKIGLKQAGEQRSAENLMFQSAISDQRATAVILKKALKKLEEFYAVQDSSLIQVGSTSQVPVESRSKVALVYLQTIIRDAVKEEKTMLSDEQSAEETYSAFVKDTSSSIQSKEKLITEKQEELASAEAEKSDVDEKTIGNDQELAKKQELLAAYKTDCDFLIKYFDVRQKARLEEMDAILDAKSLLAGASSDSVMK